MTLNQNLKITLITLHCVLILLINACGTVGTVLELFYSSDADKFTPKSVQFIERVLYHPVPWCYATYAGLNSIYNFYAPNVGSEFLMSFVLLDSTNKIISRKYLPDIVQNESKMRFSLCTSIMQDKFSRNKDTVLDNYIKIIFKQVSLCILKSEPKAKKIRTFIYVYIFPTIDKFNLGVKHEALLLKRYEFSPH